MNYLTQREMSRRHGGRHGLFGFVSVVLAVKLIVTKGFLFLQDLVLHQFFKAPLQLVFVELPFSLFHTVGWVVVTLTGIQIPTKAAGLVVAYPILVAGVVHVIEQPSRRYLASYWLGATAITSLSVAASLGIAPDPGGVGSGLVYLLKHHIVAELLREGVLAIGSVLVAVGDIFGINLDETVGLILSVTAVAFAYGVMWERHVGHD